MALIDKVKPRIGIYYSETTKDAEVQGMIDGAVSYFTGAGWKIDQNSPSALAVEAVVLYCKMAQSTDPAQLTNHPVLLSFIAQGRIEPLTCVTPKAEPAAGDYVSGQTIVLETTTPGAAILYTIDGTIPNDDSNVYTGAITVSETGTIKAVARAPAHYDSAVLTAEYVISG